jgi:hypothetical protein
MHYFCYISAYKVEQYLAQLPDRVADQVSRTNDFGSTREVDGKLGGLWNLLSFGAKYGRSDKIQSQVTRRTHLVEKLLFLISALEQEGSIASLEDAIDVGTSRGYDMFYVRREMRVRRFDEKIAILEANIDGLTLELSCSIRYFSEYCDAQIPFSLHSGNYHFFAGEVSPIFDALIIPIERGPDRLFASPLFLSLDSSTGITL